MTLVGCMAVGNGGNGVSSTGSSSVRATGGSASGNAESGILAQARVQNYL